MNSRALIIGLFLGDQTCQITILEVLADVSFGSQADISQRKRHVRFTCPFRKSYPDVLVMQPSQDRNGDNGARPLDCSMQGRIFL